MSSKTDNSLEQSHNDVSQASDPQGQLAIEKFLATASPEQIEKLLSILQSDGDELKELLKAFGEFEDAKAALKKSITSLQQALQLSGYLEK